MGNCAIATLDNDPRWKPTICISIEEWSAEHVATLERLHPNKRPIIWASPPCEEYSCAKTTGIRNIEDADGRVQKVFDVAQALAAHVILIENPATGILASDDKRELMAPVPYRYMVHYCQYGKINFKPTMIWCSTDLSKHGFTPKQCPNAPLCPAMFENPETMQWKHVAVWEKLTYEQRISIPDQLVVDIFKAVYLHMSSLIPPPETPLHAHGSKSRRTKKQKEIDIVHRTILHTKSNTIKILVDFKGQDRSEWVPWKPTQSSSHLTFVNKNQQDRFENICKQVSKKKP